MLGTDHNQVDHPVVHRPIIIGKSIQWHLESDCQNFLTTRDYLIENGIPHSPPESEP